MVLKKIIFFVFIIFSLFIINDFTNSIYNLWQKHGLLDRAKRTLNMENKKNIELKRRLKVVIQPQFVEKEARNKLFLVRPGESIVVAGPTVYMQASPSSTATTSDTRPNWKQWWEIFFGS